MYVLAAASWSFWVCSGNLDLFSFMRDFTYICVHTSEVQSSNFSFLSSRFAFSLLFLASKLERNCNRERKKRSFSLSAIKVSRSRFCAGEETRPFATYFFWATDSKAMISSRPNFCNYGRWKFWHITFRLGRPPLLPFDYHSAVQ